MDARNEWVSEPGTPEQLAEAMARGIIAAVVYVVALVAVVVVAEGTTDWFASIGLLVPLLWLLNWIFPDDGCGES